MASQLAPSVHLVFDHPSKHAHRPLRPHQPQSQAMYVSLPILTPTLIHIILLQIYRRSESKWPIDPTMTGVAYPPHFHFPAVPIDPKLELDDWANLSRTKPNAFLTSLLSALAAPNPISSAGPTVEEAFKSHLVSLAPNPTQMQSIPSLYSILKTFWLPSSPAYFSLTASASTARTPSEHRFLYWDPQPLVFNGIPCPSCSSPLINKGRISSGPVKIYDIEKPFFIIACEYVCQSQPCVTATSPEGRKFASTDSSILRSLPTRLKDEFPAILMYGDADAGSGPNIWNWKALGVSLSMWNLVRGCLRVGLRREVILQLVGAVQYGVPEDGEEGDAEMAGEQEGQKEVKGSHVTEGKSEDGDDHGHDDGGVHASGGSSGTAPTATQDASVDMQNNVCFISLPPLYPRKNVMLKLSVFH